MKILIISHNCLSPATNMGKTLMSYFSGFDSAELAQLYLHRSLPDDAALCRNYYRFHDIDALKSCLLPGSFGGRVEVTAEKQPGRLAPLYRYGERRTPLVYILRDLLWRFARWETKALWEWVEEFSPDVIFFASGDYGFSYRIARRVAQRTGKPLVVSCVDDHYLYNRNENSLAGRLVHRQFLKTVGLTMDRADLILTICDSLCKEYQRLFRKPCRVLHTAAPRKLPQQTVQTGGITYLGKLELKREEQLIAIGRALRSLNAPGLPQFLDVYSYDQDPAIIKLLTEENGIRFHGGVSGEQVLEIMAGSVAVVHTESFDEKMQRIVRHSVSTKIAESLMNGPCLVAYGPEGIASIDYLRDNRAAYVITHPEDLEAGLREILSNQALRQEIIARARKLAWKNHSEAAGPANLKRWLQALCGEEQKYESSTDQLYVS